MRQYPQSTAPISPFSAAQPRSTARRPLNSYVGRITCVMLFRHQETTTDIYLSASDDVLCAVWLPKALLSIDRTDRGRHLYGISYNGRVWDGDKPLDGLTDQQRVAHATGKAA